MTVEKLEESRKPERRENFTLMLLTTVGSGFREHPEGGQEASLSSLQESPGSVGRRQKGPTLSCVEATPAGPSQGLRQPSILIPPGTDLGRKQPPSALRKTPSVPGPFLWRRDLAGSCGNSPGQDHSTPCTWQGQPVRAAPDGDVTQTAAPDSAVPDLVPRVFF